MDRSKVSFFSNSSKSYVHKRAKVYQFLYQIGIPAEHFIVSRTSWFNLFCNGMVSLL